MTDETSIDQSVDVVVEATDLFTMDDVTVTNGSATLAGTTLMVVNYADGSGFCEKVGKTKFQNGSTASVYEGISAGPGFLAIDAFTGGGYRICICDDKGDLKKFVIGEVESDYQVGSSIHKFRFDDDGRFYLANGDSLWRCEYQTDSDNVPNGFKVALHIIF